MGAYLIDFEKNDRDLLVPIHLFGDVFHLGHLGVINGISIQEQIRRIVLENI